MLLVPISLSADATERCDYVNDSEGNYTVSCPNPLDNPSLYDDNNNNKKHKSIY